MTCELCGYPIDAGDDTLESTDRNGHIHADCLVGDD